MLKSKAELIQDEKAGKTFPRAVYSLSNVAAVCACEWDDEQMFGFSQVMDGPKEYFRVKLNYNSSQDQYFVRIGKMTLPLDSFCNTSQRWL